MILPLLCIAAQVIAQDAPPTAPPDPDPTLLTFAAAETRMTVPVRIAEAGPYPFIVDTGAQRTVISRQLAAKLGLTAGRTVRVTSMSGTSDVGTVRIPSLSVSPISRRGIEAPALEDYNLGASGLLGIDSLQDHAVSIDFDAQTMAVRPSRKRSSREKSDSDEIVIRAKNLFGQLVVTDARYRSHRVRIILDTGSAVSMGNQALRRAVMRGNMAVRRVEMTSATGGIVQADYTALDRIMIGDVGIKDMPIAFADAAPFRVFGLTDKPAIMLGMDAMKLFRRVDIDFANRQVRLALPRDTVRS